MRRVLSLLPLALALSACASRPILSPGDRATLVRASARQARFLRVAMYAGPFFGDEGRLFLSARPAAELALSAGPGEKPLPAPAFERILAPGTPFFVEELQFPTGIGLLVRPSSAPRDRPWVLGRVPGETRGAVLVLSAGALTADDLVAEMGRLLTADDPSPALRALPDGQRAAIGKKEVVEGMARDAVAMAWGYPDRISIDDVLHTEEWVWSEGQRRAVFQDDRLVHFDSLRPDRSKG